MIQDPCKDCPGYAVIAERHLSIVQAMSRICKWKDDHESDQKNYREKREVEEQNYREKMYDNFNGLKSSIGKWAIGLLTGTVTILIVQLIIMWRE